MPEPELYDSRSSPRSIDSPDFYSSSNGDLLRKATDKRGSNNRRLPEPPRPIGLPSDVRPVSKQREPKPDVRPSSSSSRFREPASDFYHEPHRNHDQRRQSPQSYRSPTSPTSNGPDLQSIQPPSRDYFQDPVSYFPSQEAGPSFAGSNYRQPTSADLGAGYADPNKSQYRNIGVNNSPGYSIMQSSSSSSSPSTLPPPQIYQVPLPEPVSPTDNYYDVGPSNVNRRPSAMLHDIANYSHTQDYEEDAEPEFWEDEDEGEDSFVNFALLSHLAVQLKDKVPRGTHVKGSIPYPRAFTGKDIVSTIQLLIQRELAMNHGMSTNDRRAALQVARSLQSQLYFYEVEWGGRVLQDGVEDVYMFLDDQEGASSSAGPGVGEELPTGVVTMLTKCYVATCVDEAPCYSYSCPRRGNSILGPAQIPAEQPLPEQKPDWPSTVPKEVLDTLPESEINRQTIIHKIIHKEDQYLQDLDVVETDFIRPLRRANPPVISPASRLDDFIDEVFGNILDLRECNRRLLEVMYVRQREQQ